MGLDEALHLLVRIHTGDSDATGFIVRMGATPHYGIDCSPERYVAAWKAVREHIHVRTEPGQYPPAEPRGEKC